MIIIYILLIFFIIGFIFGLKEKNNKTITINSVNKKDELYIPRLGPFEGKEK